MKSWFAGTASSVNSEIITPFSNAEQIIYKYNQAIAHNSLTQQGWQQLIAQCDDGLASYLTNIKGSTASMSAYSVSLQGNITGYTKITQAMKQYNALGAVSQKEQQNFATAVSLTNTKLGSYLTGLNGAKASLSGYGVSLIASTAKTVGLTIATTALNAALTFGISAIVTGVISAFATWINSSKKITEAAEEAKDKISSINDDLKTNTETVENAKQRYAELAQEVENLGKVNQSRGSLSTDEYKEFLDLSNQLAGVFPQLTKGYDDNGNAILDLSGNVNTIVGSLDDLLQKEKDLANQKIMDEFPDVYKGYIKDLGEAQSEVKSAKAEFDKVNNAYQQLQNSGGAEQAFDLQGNGTFENADGEQVKVTLAEYEQALKDLGIEYEKTNIMVKNQFGGDTLSGYLINATGDIDTAFTNKLETAKKNLDYAKQQLEGKTSSISSYLNTWLQTEFTYNQIDDAGLQTAVQDMIMNFDFSNLPENVDEDNWNEVSEYLRRNILFAINDVQDDPDISNAISEVFTNQDLTPDKKADYLKQIKDYFDNELGKDNAISIALQPQIDDTEALQKSYDGTINRFKSSEEANLEELKQSYQEAIDKRKELYSGENYVGNVDINNRPVVINDDGSYSTTSTSFQEKWVGDEENGHYIIAHFTPILPDGTVLDEDSLNEYIDKILNSDDPMEADKVENGGKGIVYKVDTQINGKDITDDNLEDAFGVADAWDVDMHNLQDKMYKDEAAIKAQIAKFDDGVYGSQKIKDFFDTEGINTDEEINDFNEVTKGINDADKAIQIWNEHKKESNETPISPTSFKDAWKSIPEDTGNALTELAKAGELTVKTFHSTSGADEWAKSFKNLGLTTDDVVRKINQMQNSADQLSSMKTGISGIAQILGQKKSNLSSKKTRNDGIGADVLAGLSDEVKQNKKEYEEFCEVLGNGNSTMEDCRKASNKLASAYVNSSNFLAKLTPETKAYYTSVLDEMGVENASQVVKDTLAKKNELLAAKKKYLAEQGENVANAEAKDITKFAESKNYSDQLTNSLLLLAMRKKLVNGTQLNFDSDIGQIKSFVKAIGAQITALNALQNWKRNQSKLQGMPEDVRQIKKQEYMKDAQKEVDAAVKKAEKGTKVKVDVTPDISNTGSGGNSKKGNSKKDKSSKDKSKDSKQEIDWIARKLEVLQKAIDTTSGKLQNLFSIKAKKSNINKQITKTTTLLKANRKAAKAYTAEANKVVIDKKNKKRDSQLKAKVRSGDYDITKYSSKTADKINKYQDLIDKAREAQNAVQDNIASIHDLNQQKLDNITTWYDKLLEKIDAVTSKFQAKADLTSKVRGMLGQAETGTKTEYTDILKNQKSALKTSQTELKKYEAERKAQRKKLVNKNKSKRQTTKDRLKRSGLSKKAINKKLNKFDKKNGKQLADFDATTKSKFAQLKENVYSAMSEMLDTAQSLANIPLEKLSVTLDKLSTQFTALENQASRATKEIENVGTGLDYYTRKSQEQIDNKSEAQYKARLAKEKVVSYRDAAANKLRAKGIDPSTIKTASDLKKLSSKDTDAMYWASQYLAGVSAVNDATSKLSSVQEDYASTVSSVTDNIIDERNKLYENERSKEQSKHSNEEKKWSYTDSSLQDRLDTIDAKLDHAQTDTIDSYKEQTDKSLQEANHSAASFYGYKTMGYLDSQPAWVQKAWNQAYGFMQKGYNFNPETDDIADVYISSDILEAIKQAVQDGYLPSTEYENAVKYNENIADGNTQYQTYANNKATYDYETVPNSFKEIFSTISDDANRTVSDIQRNIDTIENSLDSDLFANKTDSYKKEADYYQTQEATYRNEGDALRKQLALAEAKGLKQGSDTWNEMMDQIHTADDNAEKAAQSYMNAVVNAFNSIGDIADRKITEIGKSLSKLDTQMSLYETQGHFITSEFYNEQGDLYQQQREAELKKATDLQAELDAGDIKEYSARWYEMKDKIDEATQSADDYSVKIAEATNKAFDAILQLGEKSREAISRMNDEADFYQDILGRDKTVNSKTGAFTENGVASISLSYEKMTNDMVLNNNIKRDIDKVKERYANGTNPDYGIEKYNEDMDNLLSQQREAIKNYYDEREAVMSLVQDGLQKQLDYLQKIVDKYKEAINEADDLRSYNKSVEDATKEITSLEKQLLALQGNDTEEGRANKQSVEKQLQDARQNLDDIEWDKHKSDVEEILDQLMEDAQDHVDEKIDQVIDSIDQIRVALPSNATAVSKTLKDIDDLWGTRISEHLADAVKLGDYSTINSHIDSAASTIAQGVYKDTKNNLENGSGNGTTGNAPDHKPPSQPSQNTKPGYKINNTKLITSFPYTPGAKAAAIEAIKNFDPLKTTEGLKAVIKPYLLNGSLYTDNVMSTPRMALDAMTYDSTGDGTIFSDRLGLNGKIPDYNVPKLLADLGYSDVTSATIETQVCYLITELKNRIDNLGGFSKGGIVGALNNQVRKNNDDALISVQSGEGILTPQQTEMFQKLVGELPTLVNIADVKVPNFPTTQNTSKTVNVELGDMHFDLPNVTDTDSFINAWKTDNKMKNFVSDVVTGAVTGDNSKAMRY